MKRSKIIIAVLAVLSLASMYTVAQDQSVPTKKEVTSLLKTANEPPQHRRIAAYYRAEGAKLRQTAKEHSELAAIYQHRQPFAAMESKHGDAFGQGTSHCKKFAELATEQANEADALAKLHEEMAVAAERK